MPGEDGKLTQEDREKVIAWMNQYKATEARCPICSSPEWMLAERLVQPLTLGKNAGLMLGGEGYPLIMLISNPCGYTRFLNAVMIGLLEGPKAPPSKMDEKG